MPEHKKLGIGVVGVGGIASGCHIPACQKLPDKCSVVALADTNADAMKAAAAKFRVEKMYDDYMKLVADPEVDAIIVATPNYAHLEPTVAALNAGKDVLCEKPLARNADEGRKMVRAAKDNNRILQVALQYRFTGFAQYVKRFIDAGKLGDVYYARAQALRRRGIPGWGVFIDREKQGGGPLIDIGVHILDLTLFLMGYPKPVSACGLSVAKFGKRPGVVGLMGQWDHTKFTVEDFAAGFIRFENGACVVLESSFCANIKSDIFATELLGDKSGVRVVPHGEEFQVQVFGEAEGALFRMQPTDLPSPSAYDAEVAAFVDAVRERKPSPVPGEQGLILNAIFDALYRSSESCKEEPVNLAY